jgi:hypothetical protein
MGTLSELVKKNYNLDNKDVKNKILKYLHQRVDIEMKHVPITTNKEVDIIRNNDYIICPRFEGTRSWIIFFQTKQDRYAVNFPKQGMHKQVKLKIFPIDMDAVSAVYGGSIMEGIFYRVEDECYLVVDEIYMLNGVNLLTKNKSDRLNMLIKILPTHFSMKNKFRLHVSQCFRTNESDIIELNKKIMNDNRIQELLFYPSIYSQDRPIYKYTIISTDLVPDIVTLATFKMFKTDKPDVYNLVCISKEVKKGIAYIPDMETSKKCKLWMKKKKETTVICKYLIDKNKWMPMEEVEKSSSSDEESSSFSSSEEPKKTRKKK